MPAVCYTFHLSRRAKRTKCDALSIFDIFFLKTRRSFVSFVSKKRIHVIRDIVHPVTSNTNWMTRSMWFLSRMANVCYTFRLSRRVKRTKCDALSIFDIFFLKTRRSFVSFVSKKRIHVIRDIVHPTQSGWHDQCDFWCQGCRPSVTRFICRAYRRYLLIGQREQNVMCLSAVLSTHVTRCDRSRVLVFLYWCGNQPRTYVL